MSVLQHLLSDPETTLETILSNVRAGCTLEQLCKNWGVPRIRMVDFISSCPHRQAAFDAAVDVQSQYFIERTLTELSRIAFSDLRQAFDPVTHTLLLPSQWPNDLAHAIESVDVSERYEKSPHPDDPPTRIVTRRIKLHNKMKSLELLAKYLGLLNDKPLTDSLNSIADAITQARARVINNKPSPVSDVYLPVPMNKTDTTNVVDNSTLTNQVDTTFEPPTPSV